MANALSFIPADIVRNLADKLDDKRKSAAIEVEGIVKELVAAREHSKIDRVITLLTTEFVQSGQISRRKGGLTGLSAVAVGLATLAALYKEQIVRPVLNCLLDEDSGVRYIACEALYNIVRVVRGDLIIYFSQVFDALCKLSADLDEKVRSAAQILNRLIKDVVTESNQFSIEEFMPLLRERMSILNRFARKFVLEWIIVLDACPEIDLLSSLPDFLDGLFNMLSDSNHEIRQLADNALSEFLQEIKDSPNVDFGRLVETLVQRVGSQDELIRLASITWINELLRVVGDHIVPYYANIVGAVLPCISDTEEKIRAVARETNEELRTIRLDLAEGFDIGAVLTTARRQLDSEGEATRFEALLWMSVLLDRYRAEVICYLNDIFDSLLRVLADPSDEVVLLVLEVHASIARDASHFHQVVVFLVDHFRSNNSLLEKRGALVVRQLCNLLDAEQVYREFSIILEVEDDLNFASTMIQTLNLILLTSSELAGVRAILKQSLANAATEDLFVCLYSSWCHSPISTIFLCLLAQAYHHASSIIQSLGEEDINTKFLVQLDKLIRLLESPSFIFLRFQLLEPGKHVWLLKSLYGLLMLLPPQTEAFKILRTRLKTVSSYALSVEQMMRPSLGNPYSHIQQVTDESNTTPDAGNMHNAINFELRLQQFELMRNRHRTHAKALLHSHT